MQSLLGRVACLLIFVASVTLAKKEEFPLEENTEGLNDFGSHNAAKAAPLTSLASGMMFGTITFATVAMAVRSYFSGDLRVLLEAADNSKSTALDVNSFTSIYTLLHHLTIFGLILLYAFICEYHPPFPHSNKSYDRDQFFFISILVLVASLFTWRKNVEHSPNATASKALKKPEKSSIIILEDLSVTSGEEGGEKQVAEANEATDVLNRFQTEEWKGWMQIVFLLYHYYRAEETYNAIRIMITCYVWMTGFGNFSFFYLKGDYSFIRVVQMLWRLNFLVIFLCLSQGTTYILYYICLLHTYYFLMVYGVMRAASNINYTKWGIRLKLSILGVIIFAVWDVNSGLFWLLHFVFLLEKPTLGATSGSLWEWYFRSSLDHWSTFLGMIFALNYPITSLMFRKLEAQEPKRHFMGKGAIGAALLFVFLIWVNGPFMLAKRQYNATNAYFGIIPLLTYIFFRNLTPWLREHTLHLLHEIGKTTLETYLMQHHIWLTSDAKSLLTLVPGWPKLNFLLVSIIYFAISRRLYQMTLFLRGMLLPNNRDQCVRNMIGMGIVIAVYVALAFSLRSLGIMGMISLAAVSIFCGCLLYKTIMDETWRSFQKREKSEEDQPSDVSVDHSRATDVIGRNREEHESTITSLAPPVGGALVVLIIGLAWQGFAQLGASKIGPLPPGCEVFVNDGIWIPVDACNEESRGASYRSYGIASFATCSPESQTFVWGWNETSPSTHCRFTRRDSKSLQETLKHRTVTFVGDSITRHLFFATCRSLGMETAGAYNTKTPKQSDRSFLIGKTNMEFEWAALSNDVLTRIKAINNRPDIMVAKNDEKVKPDLLVLGGGAWDRLHEYATKEKRDSHRTTVKDLAKQMRAAKAAGIPVVWVIPTTINTPALTTQEKQDNLREEDIEAMRAVYANLGVLASSSFVIDGPSFTASRVTESYDGVHYPLAVYDAGAQILANSLDWLLTKRDLSEPFVPPPTGTMAKPVLGVLVLMLAFAGLFFFDGFLGVSYLASFFVKGVKPTELFVEAFTTLHERSNLPEMGTPAEDNFSSAISLVADSVSGRDVTPKAKLNVDDEIASLLGNTEEKAPEVVDRTLRRQPYSRDR